jgi:hypothetical protein
MSVAAAKRYFPAALRPELRPEKRSRAAPCCPSSALQRSGAIPFNPPETAARPFTEVAAEGTQIPSDHLFLYYLASESS